MQEEIGLIFQKLDHSIIAFSQNGINYSNQVGQYII